MNKILTLVLGFALLGLNAQTENNSFVGRWMGNDETEIGYIIFDDEGYAHLEARGQVLGGDEFVINGRKGSMTYSIDHETAPIQIDLTITDLESGKEMSLLCIANFLDNDSMQFAIGFEGGRPSDFDTDNSIVLNREK